MSKAVITDTIKSESDSLAASRLCAYLLACSDFGEPCNLSRHDQLMLLTGVLSSEELKGSNLEVQFNISLQLEEIANVEAGQLRACARKPPIDKRLRTLAHKIYEERRLRDRIFGKRLFGEPAWDMLLALYCFPARGEFLTVTSLSYAADVPQATGLRWQKSLQELGMIERGPDGVDARKKFIRLTSTGSEMMERILIRLLHLEPDTARWVALGIDETCSKHPRAKPVSRLD